MTAFPITALLLSLLAIGLLLIPLLRGDCITCRGPGCRDRTGRRRHSARVGCDDDAHERARLRLYRQKLAEAEADRDAGRLGEAEYQAVTTDLARELLRDQAQEEGQEEDTTSPPAHRPSRSARLIVAVLVALLIPTVAFTTYIHTGSGNAGLEAPRTGGGDDARTGSEPRPGSDS